jgi:hypothetical protein
VVAARQRSGSPEWSCWRAVHTVGWAWGPPPGRSVFDVRGLRPGVLMADGGEVRPTAVVHERVSPVTPTRRTST